MLRLLKLEWSKFRKNTVIRLLITFFCLFFPACLYFGSVIPDLPALLPDKKSFFQFPAVWEYLGYAGNWMVFFFLGVCAIYIVTIEVSNKTLRQSIINGMSRNEYFVSKVLSITVLATFATLIYIVLGIGIGIYNGENFQFSDIFKNQWAFPRFFLMSFAYLNFALFLAFLFRKSGLAVFFYISYIIVIEPLMRYVIINNISNKASYTNYFPMNAAEDLMPLPLMKFGKNTPNNIDFDILLNYNTASFLTIGYIILFLGLGYWLFKKNDL